MTDVNEIFEQEYIREEIRNPKEKNEIQELRHLLLNEVDKEGFEEAILNFIYGIIIPRLVDLNKEVSDVTNELSTRNRSRVCCCYDVHNC